MTTMRLTEFGNPVLRAPARHLTPKEMQSKQTHTLIKDMRSFLLTHKLGIGLAAPQVGSSLAIAVIAIRSTVHRPEVQPYDLVIINPEITLASGRKKAMWEGCLSAGKGGLFALTPRYNKIKVKYLDEHGKSHEATFSGLKAQVLQHEIDHLNGVLFVDHVRDPKTYMTLKEYKKRVVQGTLTA